MLQMMRSLKSSLSLHSGWFALLGGTTHESPSSGKQSKIAFPKGRYGTSNSSRRLSCSASLLSAAPSARTKWPSGYREVASQRSMLTRIFWPSRAGAWRVRRRIRGNSRETGVAKTVCWESEVVFELESEVRSMWQTYLVDVSVSSIC